VRAGLVALLGFFEDEPCFGEQLFEAVHCAQALTRERSALGVLTVLLNDGSPRTPGEISPDAELTSELVAGGVLAVIRTQMREARELGERVELVELAPSLTAFILTPFLGQAVASAELTSEPSQDQPRGDRTSYKRQPAAMEVVFTLATGTCLFVDRGSHRCVSSQTSGVGGSSERRRPRRSIVNREDKGVVDK
jgi:hypothetical protein